MVRIMIGLRIEKAGRCRSGTESGLRTHGFTGLSLEGRAAKTLQQDCENFYDYRGA